MLIERRNIAQIDPGLVRRVFGDERFELVTWENSSKKLELFHLSFDLGDGEKLVTWQQANGFKYGSTDKGEELPTYNSSPVLKRAKPFDAPLVVPDFFERSRKIDAKIAHFVIVRLCEFGNFKFDIDAESLSPARIATAKMTSEVPKKKIPVFYASGPASAALTNAPERMRSGASAGEGRLPEELLKKVRHIEVTTRKLVNDAMSGQYRTRFKGHGMQFSEHRLYVPGDDVRHIDWKVTARTRDPLIKKYEEERELAVLLVVDVSGSEGFGSTARLKSEVAAEIGGMVAYAATHSGDKVGALLFSDTVEKVVPVRKGRQHVLRLIRDLLSYRPKGKGTDLGGALEAAGRIMKHQGIVFVLSDFIAGDYSTALKRLARRHDVIAVRIADERETEVPDVGRMLVLDPETGQERWLDTGSYQFKKWLNEFKKKHETETDAALKGGRVEQLKIMTKEDYGEAVVRFFRARKRRRA